MGIGGNSTISFNKNGTSSQVLTPEEIVKQRLVFLLETSRGELPNRLDYGADLISFTFVPIDNRSKSNLRIAVTAAIGQFMPYVLVDNIEIINSGYGFLRFELFYTLSDSFKDSVEIKVGE